MIYTQAIKYGIIIAIVIGWHAIFANFWINHEAKQWQTKIQAQAIEQQIKLQAATKETLNKERELSELAQKIEATNNEAQDKIDQLERDNIKLFNSGMRSRKVCGKSSSNRMSEANSSGSIIESAAEQELSTEFKEFLISDAKRADAVGLYADTAYQWIQDLCKEDQLACPDIPAD